MSRPNKACHTGVTGLLLFMEMKMQRVGAGLSCCRPPPALDDLYDELLLQILAMVAGSPPPPPDVSLPKQLEECATLLAQ